VNKDHVVLSLLDRLNLNVDLCEQQCSVMLAPQKTVTKDCSFLFQDYRKLKF